MVAELIRLMNVVEGVVSDALGEEARAGHTDLFED